MFARYDMLIFWFGKRKYLFYLFVSLWSTGHHDSPAEPSFSVDTWKELNVVSVCRSWPLITCACEHRYEHEDKSMNTFVLIYLLFSVLCPLTVHNSQVLKEWCDTQSRSATSLRLSERLICLWGVLGPGFWRTCERMDVLNLPLGPHDGFPPSPISWTSKLLECV